MKKKWLFIISIIIIGITFTIVVYYVNNTKKRDVSFEIASHHVYANELIKEFETDETKANQKYNNDVIEIKGKIGEVIKNQDNKLTLILKEKNDIFGINCAITTKDFNLARFVIGDSISITGIFQGYLDDVIINNCIINK